MKVIDFNNVKKICSQLNSNNYLEWIEYALRHKNDFVMPPKTRISQENGDYYAIMPCMYEEENIAMTKMIGRHLLKDKEVRSTMMSDMMLYEADTGVLKALIDGEYITTLRTGAAAAHAALMYGKDGFTTIGLIGLGNIMTVCISLLVSRLQERKLVLKLYKHNGQENRLIDRLKSFENIQFVLCDTYEETIKGSEVVISAVTRTVDNFCSDECFDEGCTVIPIMTLGFQNCDLFFDKVFTDEIEQIKGFKYFDEFKSIENTTDVLLGKKNGRENDKERILVYYYGLAIHDLYFATKILNNSMTIADTSYNYCKEKFFV